MEENAVLRAEQEQRTKNLFNKDSETSKLLRNRCFMEKLNEIIREATLYGYYEDRTDLLSAMRGLLRWAGANENVGIMDNGGNIQFYLKEDIVD